MRQNFNQNQGQPQFNQNYNGNQGSQQQQPRMQQGQQFQNNGNGQHQRDNISQGNEWDSFFQSSGVNNNGGNLRGNNQFNGGNQRDNMYDPVQNNSVVNDLAANQLLRGAFQQNNSSGIDQSMKQSLAKTMGLLGTPNLNSAVVQQRMALQNGGGGGGNLMQGRANNPLNNMNNNIGGNNGMIPGSYNTRNAGGNQNNNFGSGQGGRNMGGDGNNFNNVQQGRPQQNFNNNVGYDDDNSYDPYPVNNSGGMRGSGGGGGGGNYNNGGNVGNRGGGNLGGNNNFQQGGNQRFNSMGGNNNSSYDEYEPSGQGQSSAPYNSNVPDPLSVLNKLNNIVAVTGGGLSAAQLQRAIQNPAGISHANPQQLLGITSGGPQRFPTSGGVPQRNLNAPMNNNLGGNPGLNRPVNSLGGNLNINANPIRNNAGVEVLPGDVRYRGNAPGGNTAGGNSSFGGVSQGIRQVQLGGGGGQNNYQGNNISGSGGVRNLLGGGGAGGGQWSSQLGGAAGVNNNNLNNVRDNFNNSNNNSFSQQRGSNQQSFDNNIGNVSGNNSIASNNRSTSKWSTGSENPLDALFASGGGNNAGGAPRNLNTHNSAVPSAANGPIRKIAKGGFPGTSNYPTNPNVNVMLHSFSGNKRDRSNSSSRSRSPPTRRDFRDDHHNNNSSNYNNSRDSDYNQGGRGSGGRGRGGGRGDLDSGRGRGFGGRNSTRSPPRGNARGPLNSNSAGPLSPGPSSHSGGQGGRKEVDYVNLPPHALVEDFNIPAIPKNLHTITSVDLYTKFPNLYVPADFISVEVDWKSITASLYSDKICDITNSVPIVFENLPSALQPSAVTAGVTEAPKYTYLGANTVNNTITNNYTHYSHNHIQTQRPVKFNAKVIISCGMANSGDRIDHLLPRKLRVLCGRRKGQVMLLGSSWCAELDGGNPLEDRSCLLNTARRAVYAQSLLDIYNPTPASTTVDEFGNTVAQEQQEQCFDVTSNLTKLCEINYHRPKEEINNKLYPEQEEITAIYLYTIQPDSLPLGLQGLDSAWEIFSGRVKGENAGPMMNLNVDQFHEERLQTARQAVVDGEEATHQHASEESAQVAEAKEEQLEIKSEETADTVPAFVGETSASTSEEGAMQVDASAAAESAESSMEIAIDRTGDAAAAAAHSSAVSAEVKEEAPAVTATATTTANTTTTSAPATVVVPKTELVKPDAPTIFLCPAPLPKEIFDDNAKRQEAVALRMLPLSAILSYSPDDCSERIFEASIAGEFIRSIISVSNANIIVDFLIAENPVLSSLADIRVVQSVKRLREIVAASKAKLSAPAIAVAVAAAGSATATGALDVSAPSSEQAVPVAVTAAAEAEEMDAASTATTAGSDVGAASEILTDSAVVSTEGSDSVQNDVTSESAMAVETSAAVDETAMVGTEAHSTTEDAAAQAQQDDSPLVLVSDEEARTWRRRFVAACRWFDADQERLLPRDLIQLIIHSSTRNMSRADVSAATDLVCRAGKISYETFV